MKIPNNDNDNTPMAIFSCLGIIPSIQLSMTLTNKEMWIQYDWRSIYKHMWE